MTRRPAAALLLVLAVAMPTAVHAQDAAPIRAVPTPQQHFGFEIGTDRSLADWDALTSYYEALAQASPRVRVDTLGMTTKNRPFVMVTVTSPENHARLGALRDIQHRLADPRTITGPDELEQLLDDGRVVALITHAIHSTEVGSAQTAARMLYKLASSNEPWAREILDNVILLDIPSLNPDGTDWVAEWYMEHVGSPYEGSAPPWLYQFYVGHDNNRDWYAFTQQETQLAIEHAHNVWRPHIVHDIHQMGGTGARIFFPPYIDPVEPNVDPGIVAALNQLGMYMAAELTAQGKPGVVINAIYDAFTPARAYQHYHGGVRILSETASAQLATPVDVPRERVRGGREYDAAVASWKHPLPWTGGEWALGDIVDYMEAGALALLKNAAKNRRFWLENFHAINERAVRGWESWPAAWVLPDGGSDDVGLAYALRILTMADVEVHRATVPFTAAGRSFPAGSYVIPMAQPYASFAQTMLEVQNYPDLREFPGGPPKRPYDVTAHTLPLLMDFEAVAVEEWSAGMPALSEPIGQTQWRFPLPAGLSGPDAPRIGFYKSAQEPMEAGWTRWVFDMHGLPYDSLKDARIRAGDLRSDYDVILLQSQSPRSIINGYAAGSMPDPYTGGLGQEGQEALREFVRGGGRIVAIEEATDFVADLFDLPVSDAVDALPPQDFYIPGSILGVNLTNSPLATGIDRDVDVWYWGDSRAFDIGNETQLEVLGRYAPESGLRRSGWLLGAEHVAGKPALVRATVGQGDVVLFGFQPNYRGQTVATWPLLWNALRR